MQTPTARYMYEYSEVALHSAFILLRSVYMFSGGNNGFESDGKGYLIPAGRSLPYVEAIVGHANVGLSRRTRIYPFP